VSWLRHLLHDWLGVGVDPVTVKQFQWPWHVTAIGWRWWDLWGVYTRGARAAKA